MRLLFVLLCLLPLTGCANRRTAAPSAPPAPPFAPSVAVAPATRTVETRYEVRPHRDRADPALRHEAHAVYRSTRVPVAADEMGSPSAPASVSASHAPLPASAELAAELATQRAITADLRALQTSLLETERRLQTQYTQLVRRTEEAGRLREQLEAERARLRAAVPAAPPLVAEAPPTTEATW